MAVSIPAAGFLVRLFMIQHDCGHGSLFRQRWLNNWVGRVVGDFTLTPYSHWRHSHNIHHASSGNLERRGIGDITTLTVSEYCQSTRWQRLGYRLYRNPAVMFGIGPALPLPGPGQAADRCHRVRLTAMVQHHWDQHRHSVHRWYDHMVLRLVAFLLVHVPITMPAASIGVWLFYVQHQFEDTFWADASNWTQPQAALYGSSHCDLPGLLRWFTASIGIHHVHHLCSGIPYYRLTSVLRAHPELGEVGRLTLMQSLRCVPLVLWDEEQRRLISFRELARRGNASA